MPLTRKLRLAIIVSHPIQYYVPLYQRLAERSDLDIKVFFTWHADAEYLDRGFETVVAWDIPLVTGYEFELVPNVSVDPGTHHFFGLRNPTLVPRIIDWAPDAVHVTGWAWHSHLVALRTLHQRGINSLFRGDSHLLDAKRSGLPWHIKRMVLERVFSWPAAFLFVGTANRNYYEAFGVEPSRLFLCPHSIDVARFSDQSETSEVQAAQLRAQLGILPDQTVLLFAGKFERRKQPLELMRAVIGLNDPRIVLVMIGSGELDPEVRAIASSHRSLFRVLPFQNQSQMPIAYRLGNLFILPSAYGETWGLAVNEAMACGRPSIVSNRVGCAPDMIDSSCGRVFPWNDFSQLKHAVLEMTDDRKKLAQMSWAAARRARQFDISRTEEDLVNCLRAVSQS